MNYTKKLPILEELDFQDKKLLSLSVVEKYQYFDKKKTQNMIDCGQRLQFGLFEHLHTLEHQKKLEEMYTCKDRFCPFCNWRRARKLGIQSYDVLKAIQGDFNVRYIFATFTVKNCPVGELSSTIKLMNSAFKRMVERDRFQNSILGFMRVLEIPPQKDNFEFIHPHFHCLFVVPAQYFDNSRDLYIKQNEWIQRWADALRVDYLPSVDIRIIKSSSEADPIAKAVAETVKYPLKHTDFKNMPIDLFEILTLQMKNKRALAFGGIVKEYRKKLILDDVENGDLIYDGLENELIWKRIATLIYDFKMGEYGLNYYERNNV